MAKLNIPELLDFLKSFHSYIDFEKKFHLIGDFLAKKGVSYALFLDSKTGEIKRLIGNLEFNEDKIRYIKENLSNSNIDETLIDNYIFRVLPIHDGIMELGKILYLSSVDIDEEIKTFAQLELICLIRNLNVYVDLKKRQNEILTLKMLSQLVSNFFNLEQILKVVVEYVTKALECKGTVIRLVNKSSNLLEMVAEYGLESINIRRTGVKKGSGISGQVWESGQPILVIPNTDASRELLNTTLKVGSLICVPLIFEKEVIGTISVYEKITLEPFTEEDKIFLEVIGSLISPIISYVAALEREKKLSEIINANLKDLNLITEINKIIMQPRDIDELLYVILTALTFGEDIGFNRAAIFTYNFNTGVIQGMLGVGCNTHEETEELWKRLPKDISSIRWIKEYAKFSEFDTTPFNEKIKRLRFDLNNLPNILSAIKLGKIYHSEINENDQIKEVLNVKEYAIVPLTGKDSVLGLVYVDNKFTERPIDERYIKILNIFASQAALAIENSKLLSELKETNNMLKLAQQEILVKEKLAAIGEMLSTLAHEIRNPITAIGGFAKIIEQKTQEDNIKELAGKIYLQTIKMDELFKDFISLGKGKSDIKNPIDIKKLICESIEDLKIFIKEDMINVNVNLCEDNVIAEGEKKDFKLIFNNIIKNAIEAIEGRGSINITLLKDENNFTFIVEDDGLGINRDVLPRIYDPFFTTKFKGVGIGLAATYKVVKEYGGDITAENRVQKGAIFTVKIPLKQHNQEVGK